MADKGEDLQQTDKTPTQLVGEIRKKMLMIKGSAMSEDGSSVDYTKVRESEGFAEYTQLVKQLKFVDMGQLSADEMKAFLINIYNSLVIHSIINGLLNPAKAGSTVDRVTLYATASYNIGNMIYSLNDMENGLLRANR